MSFTVRRTPRGRACEVNVSFQIDLSILATADIRRKVAKRRLESEPSYEALTRIKQKRHRQRPLLLPFQPR